MRPRQVFCGVATAVTAATIPTVCAASNDARWTTRVGERFAAIIDEGDTDLYLPLITHHLRFAYPREKIDNYEETPLGFGVGRSRDDSAGNWEGLFAMGFKDSHSRPQWLGGYGWKAIWQYPSGIRTGLGYSVFLTARSDIANYLPIPAAVPIASLGYRSFDLQAAYVPGGNGYGNIVFVWAKWRLASKEEP